MGLTFRRWKYPQRHVTSALAPKIKKADYCQGESGVETVTLAPPKSLRLKILPASH